MRYGYAPGSDEDAFDWRRDEPRIPRPCAACGRETSSQASNPRPECLDCARARHGLDNDRWFTPIGPWHPTVPIVRPGELAPINAQRRAERPGTTCAYRIIQPARALTDAERDRLPDVLRLQRLLIKAQAKWAPPTYAMAEEIATATLVESVALRFVLADGRRGVALWWDWRWRGAIVREIGTLTREHLEAVITGAVWPPPLIGCPRCGRPVRENKDKSLRAHKRLVWHPPLTEACK